MKVIKTIIWDVGGVLERTEDYTPRRQLAAELGFEPRALEDLFFGNTDAFRYQLGQISITEHHANIARQLGCSAEEMEVYFERFFSGDRLDTELVAFIRTLHETYTTAVLSNYGSRLREKITDLWGIGDAFDDLIVSFEVGMMKPNPAIFHLALEKTSSQPHEAIFIDDSPENVGAAQALGIHAVRFTTSQAAIQQVQALLTE